MPIIRFVLMDGGERRHGKRHVSLVACDNEEKAHEIARLNTEPTVHTYVVTVEAMYAVNAPNPIVHRVKLPD